MCAAFPVKQLHCRYESVTKHGIANPRQHMQSAFPGGIALDTVFVNPSLLQQLDAAVEDAITSASWCDLQALLPPMLTAADVGALLGHSSQLQAAGGHRGFEARTQKALLPSALCISLRGSAAGAQPLAVCSVGPGVLT